MTVDPQPSRYTENFYKLPKELLTEKTSPFRKIHHSARSVFLHIAVHSNKEGFAFPSQQTIAEQTALAIGTVKSSVEALIAVDLLLREEVGHRPTSHYRYWVDKPTKRENMIFVYKDLVLSPEWTKLSPAARSLYLGMRVRARNNDFGDETDEAFRWREVDYCQSKQADLLRWSGVSRSKFGALVASLEEGGVITREREGIWGVRLHAVGWTHDPDGEADGSFDSGRASDF
ncbi:hypothetical protein DFW101_0899 [Solidesulfovibrio carbinoliphilus subsp. oakridgensis]|uniref:Uncharacterized protein n=1 Tax=Solidesulfovibrio carbinoliphilus subsp. oakridgensis TaxID=694327 RepID=G7Q5X8_9BACT|nr:helix-turn-helix domain-containing protein [Solidesulfovibrio carbinoliphilus]EHJ46915.1 hypothetical protein DFW101_0899 [Solidesulfovibrio carbinoliphilus subsp. oakridgensis]